MMKLQLRTFSAAVAALSLLWTSATSAHADEAPLCHDMSARRAVLDEGKQYLEQHGDSSAKPLGVRYLYDDSIYAEMSGPAPPIDISDSELESIPLDSARDLGHAEDLAENLESTEQFTLANKLYLRILQVREKQPADNLLTIAFESAARTEIFCSSLVPPTYAQRLRAWKQKRMDSVYGRYGRFMRRSTETSDIANAVKHSAEHDRNALLAAEEFYSRAIAIHHQLNDSETSTEVKYYLATDLLFLGWLKDRRNQALDAKALFVEALELNPKLAGGYVAEFCVEHTDFDLAKQSESKILSATEVDEGAISTLLSMYVAEKKSQDALRLFRLAMSDHLTLPVDVLISMFDLVTADDAKAVTEYLTQIAPTVPYKHLEKLILSMEQHGWDAQADSICQSIVNIGAWGHKIPLLFTVAQCYRHSKKYANAVSIYKQLAILIEQESDEVALIDFPDLITAVSSSEMKQQAGSQSLLSNAHRSIDYHKDRLRRHQCLEMAEKLNRTAFELEKNSSYGMAQKLYQQALEIKQLNLAPNDLETANQMIDVARNASEQKHYAEAQPLYERALAMLRTDPHANPADRIPILESYGQVLNAMKQEAKANKIYDEARDLSRISAAKR